ncbi:MAG: hypothetical protein J5I47_04370 [Vicingus serpentipes]|nr:hypothetical protein [Vicingus serpentipes]
MVKIIKKNTILFFLLFEVAFSSSQNSYRFQRFSVEDGLSQNSVNYIFQDHNGFIWLGTQDGLNKYDGYKFIHYRKQINDTNSLSDNFILTIAEDSRGNIWCTTRDGINRLNPTTGNCVRVYKNRYSQHNQAYKVFATKKTIEILFQDSIYQIPDSIEYTSSFVYLQENKKILSYSNIKGSYNVIAGKNGERITQDSLGITVNNYSYLMDTAFHNDWNMSNGLLESKDGNIWFGNDKGLFKWDKKSHHIKQIELLSKNLLKIMSIATDFHNNIWVATNDGLFIIDRHGTIITHLKATAENEKGISYNFIHHIYKDNSGLMWVGTANKGVNIYDWKTEQFKFLNETHGLKSNLVWSIYEDDNNDYLIGTNEGVFKIHLKKGLYFTSNNFAHESIDTIYKLYATNEKLSNARISCIAETPDDYFFGSSDGLFKVSKTTNFIVKLDINSSSKTANTITNLLMTKNQIWVTTFNGIYKLNIKGELQASYFPVENDTMSISATYILSMKQTADGNLWFGSNNGFSKYLPETNNFLNYRYNKNMEGLGFNFMFATGFIYQPNHGLWIASFGGGLNHLDTHNKFSYYTEKEGLANNVISGILADDNQNLWLSTNKGLSCFNPEKKTFTNFSSTDGLIFNEFAINSCYKNEAGELFFGTPKGLVIFNPKNIINTTSNPIPLKITDLKINYKEVDDFSKRKITDVSNFNQINLYHSDKVFSIEVSSLNYRNPLAVKYKYKLEGFDEDWVEINATNRTITYSNLAYGKYVLQIKSSNEQGVWKGEVKKITLNVLPPFWLTWWFILLEAIILISIIVLLVRYLAQRKLKARLRKIEIQQKIHQERLRISGDLHDNIGSQLTFIISSVDSIKFLFKSSDEQLQKKLTQISDFTQVTITQLRDTIWALNKDEISFENLASRLHNYVETAKLTKEQTHFNFNITSVTNFQLNAIQAVNIYRIVQEAINNGIKYAAATKITLTISETKEQVIITIKDDGIGFDLSTIQLGNGLENMKNRAAAIDADFKIHSAPEKGTEIILIMNKSSFL